MKDVDNGGGYACVGVRGKWGICVPSIQFFHKPKTALNNEVYLNIYTYLYNILC